MKPIHAIAGASLLLSLYAGAAPKSAPAKPAPLAPLPDQSGPRCSGSAATPARMALQVGKSTLMRLAEPVLHRSVGNPGVVQAMLVAPDTMYLVGVDLGSTNMIIQGKSGACSVVDIVVGMDVAALQQTLATVMPEEKHIVVLTAADSIVLTGSVADAPAAARAVELAQAYVRRPLQALQTHKGDERKGEEETHAAPVSGAAGTRVVNLLSVGSPQQVMLEVKIAEVSKSLLERLEVGATLRYATGSWVTTLVSNFLTGNAHGSLEARKSNGNVLTAEAQKSDGLVRILAEPTVMAISGQEGSFLAGGRIFIPVAQDTGRITLEEREFGVGLRFTPTVLAGGRINLQVAPEVSELSREGVGVTSSGLPGSSIMPVITTRRASTTVQLFDGQSFAIGGLIKNNLISNFKGLPVLGEIPILGALFRSTDYQQDRSELVFVVTPHLVQPLAANYRLPTDSVTAPTRGELFFGGKLEGAPAAPPPAPSTPPARPAPDADGARGFELN